MHTKYELNFLFLVVKELYLTLRTTLDQFIYTHPWQELKKLGRREIQSTLMFLKRFFISFNMFVTHILYIIGYYVENLQRLYTYRSKTKFVTIK